jgi:hypothetical protein
VKGCPPEEIEEYVKSKDVVALPLFLLDHSGLWMRTGRFECDAQGWDTSMVGYITVSREKVLKEFSKKQLSKSLRRKAIEILESEVKIYSDYLEGIVVGWVVEKDDEFDSCWGYYPNHSVLRGESMYKDAIDEAKSRVDYYLNQDRKEENYQETLNSLSHA